MDDRKVRWLCRRGMKELDVMLGRYLDERWPVAPADERSAFEGMLEMQDPDLWNLLSTGGSTNELIARIRALSGL